MDSRKGSGVMVGDEGSTRRCHPLQVRHPELVSGPIRPDAPQLGWNRNGAVVLSRRNPSLDARWVLKQVQDDENGKVRV